MNLASLALQHAASAPHKVAARCGDATLTYGALAEQSDVLAGRLRELGIARGDRILLLSANSLEHLVIYHAAARLGAVFAPVHPSFQSDELAYVLANAAPAVVFAQARLWQRLERSGAPLPAGLCVTVDRPYGDLPLLADLLLGGRARAGVEDLDDHEPALICYTSGSADRPHPVVRSHGTEVWNARTYADVWDYRGEDCALVALPLSWAWGLTALSLSLLSVGASIVLHEEFDPDDVLEEMQASGITLFAGTQSIYTALLHALDARDYDLSSLRHLYRGGEPVNVAVIASLEQRLGVAISDAYATTEAAPVLAVDPVRDVSAPAGSVGRLVPGAKLRLVDKDGVDVKPGTVGEAWLGGPGVMLCYWGEPEMTAEKLTADGWFRSGDLLVQDQAGYYYVAGRSSDLIIRNGARIAPAEVEAALNSVPGVRDSVAVGVPDEEFGESIVAFLVLEPGCVVRVDDVYDQLSDRIARFKLPSHIRFVDALPVRRNNKRDRLSIKDSALTAVGLPRRSSESPGAGVARLRVVG